MAIAYWNIVLKDRFKFLDLWVKFLTVSSLCIALSCSRSYWTHFAGKSQKINSKRHMEFAARLCPAHRWQNVELRCWRCLVSRDFCLRTSKQASRLNCLHKVLHLEQDSVLKMNLNLKVAEKLFNLPNYLLPTGLFSLTILSNGVWPSSSSSNSHPWVRVNLFSNITTSKVKATCMDKRSSGRLSSSLNEPLGNSLRNLYFYYFAALQLQEIKQWSFQSLTFVVKD